MYAVATMFDEFYLCKPYSSREANSETYLVGKGFKENISFDHPYITALLDRATGRVPINVPLFDAFDYPKDYLPALIAASENIFNAQIDKINSDVERVHKSIEKRHKGNNSLNPVVIEFQRKEEDKISAWYFYNPILPIDPAKKLRMKDALGQKNKRQT
jgi:hypothetical protein